MRTTILFLTFLIHLNVFSQKTNFTIGGNVAIAKVSKIYVEYYNDSIKINDSCPVKNGLFEYKGFISSPTSATIVSPAYMKDFMPRFIIHPNDNLYFHMPTSEFESGYVTGSQDNQYIIDNRKMYRNIDSIFNIQTKGISDTSSIYQKTNQEKKEKLFQNDLSFIKNHLYSYYSVILLNNLISINGRLADSLFNALDPNLKNTYEAKRCLFLINYKNLSAIGKMAPPFSLSDSNGNYHALKSFLGNYVLVDFWASWCGPCRAENPNFIKAYNFYKEKKFKFIGVSIDDGHHYLEWKEAIIHDKTPWLQLIDDKKENVADLYGISFIPDNVLLDPQGVIIAKGLRGEKLWQTLEKYLK